MPNNSCDEDADTDLILEDALTFPKRRARVPAQRDDVILSSKFVSERIRDRPSTPDDEEPDIWGEIPKTTAENLEKRGVEIDAGSSGRPPKKKIKLVDSWPRSERPATAAVVAPKRDTKVRQPLFSSPKSDSRQRYNMDQSDKEWLHLYNGLAAKRSLPTVSCDSFERMITLLEENKNSIILNALGKQAAEIRRGGEGARIHFMEYIALQRFLESTPETFSSIAYKEIGHSCGLSPEASFDVWEYWKCLLQDGFLQPLVPPNASEFDYRRLSLLAASNMTNVSYAQRVRHDAERVRLLLDISQKRNFTAARVSLKEDEASSLLCELAVHPEMKLASMESVSAILANLQLLSTSNAEVPASVTAFLERLLEAPVKEAPEAALSETKAALRTTTLPPPNESAVAKKEAAEARKSSVRLPRTITTRNTKRASSLSVRSTRNRLEFPKLIKFDNHSDNSCCENGPMDDEEVIRERKTSSRLLHNLKVGFEDRARGASSDDALYLLNDISQKFNLPSKSPDLRSRLRSRKNL